MLEVKGRGVSVGAAFYLVWFGIGLAGFWGREGGEEGVGTYGQREEAETEEDAGVADEGEDVHLFNSAGRTPWDGMEDGRGVSWGSSKRR